MTPGEASVALFDLDTVRRPIKVAGDHLTIGDETVSREALAERAEKQPHTFSPNVLLRPLVQDTLFPTICYVAGPNELAYHAQLRPVYDSFGVPMPLIQPRATATILDSAAIRFLTRYNVPFEDLEPRDDRALNALLLAQLPPEVEKAVQDAEAEIGARLDAIITAVPAIDPTLEGAARSTLGRSTTCRRCAARSCRRRSAATKRCAASSPTWNAGVFRRRAPGTPGRVHRIPEQYGLALVERLSAELPLESGMHWILTV